MRRRAFSWALAAVIGLIAVSLLSAAAVADSGGSSGAPKSLTHHFPLGSHTLSRTRTAAAGGSATTTGRAAPTTAHGGSTATPHQPRTQPVRRSGGHGINPILLALGHPTIGRRGAARPGRDPQIAPDRPPSSQPPSAPVDALDGRCPLGIPGHRRRRAQAAAATAAAAGQVSAPDDDVSLIRQVLVIGRSELRPLADAAGGPCKSGRGRDVKFECGASDARCTQGKELLNCFRSIGEVVMDSHEPQLGVAQTDRAPPRCRVRRSSSGSRGRHSGDDPMKQRALSLALAVAIGLVALSLLGGAAAGDSGGSQGAPKSLTHRFPLGSHTLSRTTTAPARGSAKTPHPGSAATRNHRSATTHTPRSATTQKPAPRQRRSATPRQRATPQSATTRKPGSATTPSRASATTPPRSATATHTSGAHGGVPVAILIGLGVVLALAGCLTWLAISARRRKRTPREHVIAPTQTGTVEQPRTTADARGRASRPDPRPNADAGPSPRPTPPARPTASTASNEHASGEPSAPRPSSPKRERRNSPGRCRSTTSQMRGRMRSRRSPMPIPERCSGCRRRSGSLPTQTGSGG